MAFRVLIIGGTGQVGAAVVRTLAVEGEGPLIGPRALICDRDAKWSAPVRARLDEAGIRVGRTPYQAPNANAYAERFVRSLKQACLSRAA